jgi:hypothetical protein
MSMDYPEYEELRQKSWFLRVLWRIGDMGSYFSLFCCIGWPGGVLMNQFSKQTKHLPWDQALLIIVIGMAFWFSVGLCAGSLKGFAYKRSKKLKRKL